MAGQACQTSWTACFVYNALGQRVEKYTGSAYTEIAYDAFGSQVGLHNRTTWFAHYIPFSGRPFATYQSGKTYFLHPNHLGSTTSVTDETGATTQKTIYYPWGQAWATAGTVKDNRFASMDPRDSESGNDPTLFRMYQPRLYRWLSPDPLAGDIMNPQSLNRYAYVGNNPVNFVDPLGLCENSPINGFLPECYPGKAFDWGFGGGAPPGAGVDPSTAHGGSSGTYIAGSEVSGGVFAGVVSMGIAAVCPNNDCTGIRVTTDSQIQSWMPGGQVCTVIGGVEDCYKRIPGRWETVASVGDSFNSILRFTGNFSSGAGDVLSLGGTSLVRDWTGADSVVDGNSLTYYAGAATGTAIGVAIGGYASGPKAFPSNSVLNHNAYARLGWGKHLGQSTYRFVVGNKNTIHAHLDLHPKAAVPAVIDFAKQLFK